MPPDARVLCLCCNTWMTRHRERAHRLRLETPYSTTQVPLRKPSKLLAITSISSDEGTDSSDLDDNGADPHLNCVDDPHNDIPERILRSWIPREQRPLFQQPNASSSDAAASSSSDETDDEEVEDEEVKGQDDDYPEWDEFQTYPEGVLASDSLHEGFEQESAAVAAKLSAYDCAICRAFSFKLQTNLTDSGFSKAPLAFQSDPPLPKIDSLRSRVAFLAGFKGQRYDCCSNSCICYTGPRNELLACPHCDEPRFNINGTSRKCFTYIPMIPRLLASFQNKTRAKEMLYRSQHVHNPAKSTDVFDGSLYRQLCTEKVDIDGKKLAYNHFSDARDIALGLSTDGFAPFKRRKSTAWPLILFNYNLPPETRFHVEEILALGVIPGPKKPVDVDSFLWPAILEFIQLAQGVATFDILKAEIFALHAYLMLVFGDIPAMALLMHMKGHNGFSPCRMCKILGVRIPASHSSTNYVPHDRSRHPDVRQDPKAIRVYNMASLPLRTHAELILQANEVQAATTNAEADRLSRQYGIKSIPVLSYLSSLKFPTAFPYDFMHLIWENLIKNLILHWTGDFKGLGEGSESYTLPKRVWEAVGAATAASGSTIPSAYRSRVPNVAADASICSADMWSFWTLYLGPILLRRRFQHMKYFNHFIQLVRLLNICLQFEISMEEICEICEGFIQWVQDYERIYYQYSPERVSACPVTIHALLHIADSIEACGPVWCYWAFPMERYCGKLQPALRSRRFPYAALDRFVLEDAQLTQIKLTSGLIDELSLRTPRQAVAGIFQHPSYEDCILLPPRLAEKPAANLMTSICAAVATRVNSSVPAVRKHLDLAVIEQWGKVRRVDSEEGDTMCAASLRNKRDDTRDATFVRYEMYIDIHERHRHRQPVYELQTYYGQLDHIFLLKFQNHAARLALELTSGSELETDVMILAAIRTCNLGPVDPNLRELDVHFYSTLGALHVVDVNSIQCLVGRVKDNERDWAIIDRSGSLARAVNDTSEDIDTIASH